MVKSRELKHNVIRVGDLGKTSAKKLGSLLLAVGGDGTVNAVAAVAIKYNRELAVIPQGTFNHFAKDLGVPLDIHKATAKALGGRQKKIDVGLVNDRVFLNNSVIGFYPHLVEKRESLQKKSGKWLALAVSFILIFSKIKRLRLRLSINGKIINIKTTLLIVANNKYDLKNIGLASRTRLDEGKLYVYVIKHKNVVGILVLSVRLLLGKIRRQDFDYYIADNFEIQSSKTIHHVAIDGESIKLKSPLKYKSLPKSIRVIV